MQDQLLLDLYKRQINHDRANLQKLLIIQNEKLFQWNLDTIMGGELQFTFDVFNGSILSVKVGYLVDGYLFIQSRKCHDMAEPLSSLTLDHGLCGTIMIKQRLLPEVCKEIREGASKSDGIVLNLGFENVHIYMDETEILEPNPNNFLKISPNMKFHVKRDDYPNADFYKWKSIL